MTEHGEKPHSVDDHLNHPMAGVGDDDPPPTIPPAHVAPGSPQEAMPMTARNDVKEVAAANTTAAARRQYAKGDTANRALKSAVNRGTGRGRSRTPVVPPVAGTPAARKAAEQSNRANAANAAAIEPGKPVDHSYGALDTAPPRPSQAAIDEGAKAVAAEKRQAKRSTRRKK